MPPIDPRAVADVGEVAAALRGESYLADDGLATSIFLALRLSRPLLLEGEPGVGKTEVAKALAGWAGAELIRLQCYEGIDVAQAVYEWDHARQLLHLRTAEATGRAAEVTSETLESELHGPRFLVKRPLLQAIDHDHDVPPVLLVDEIDRADDEFEAFLLEILADDAITVPEIGTIRATRPPVVVVTSNRTRDVHDALKRRCIYHWVTHPGIEREIEIIRLRAPEVAPAVAAGVAAATAVVRDLGLYKPPGVAESIDWARALALLGAEELVDVHLDATLGTLLKYREDQERVRAHGIDQLVDADRS